MKNSTLTNHTTQENLLKQKLYDTKIEIIKTTQQHIYDIENDITNLDLEFQCNFNFSQMPSNEQETIIELKCEQIKLKTKIQELEREIKLAKQKAKFMIENFTKVLNIKTKE